MADISTRHTAHGTWHMAHGTAQRPFAEEELLHAVWPGTVLSRTMTGMWFFLAPLVLIVVLACWVDWRARRRKGRIRDGTAMWRDVRDARRDARAWEAGSVGHSGEDTSWMRRRRP
ncbi:hypothetical protein [Streptomyces erythrochromogenes]|uniref:hypothetical protein n=1 Tax=Streptomyces erythrochromogenes TaxID=285574 RepID=UPI0036B628AE